MFTRAHLKSLATATSYSRGEDYFQEGNVGKIIRDGNRFTAKVYGSYTYKVKLTLEAGGVRLKCNCPYDFEGICKHRVALGLAVLEKFGPMLLRAAGPAAGLDTSPEALAKALRNTSADMQLAFLAGLLHEREDLRQEFLQQVAPVPVVTAAPRSPAETTIESISTEVYEALSDLAFDDELLSEHADHYEDYLYDEGDGMTELADDVIAEVLEPHAEAVAADVRAGRLTAALRQWLGVYEGVIAATEPQADDYDLFSYEGYPAHVLTCWNTLLAGKGVDGLLETKSFAPAEIEAALALLVERYQRPAAPGAPAALLIPEHLHDLLQQLAHDPATAARLRLLLAPADTLGQGQVLLRVAQVLADDELWLQTAEQFAGQDVTLTIQLLDHYRQHDDRANLLRVLRQGQPQYPHQLNPYILSHLAPAEDEALYLKALEQRCRNTRSLVDYRELQGYWSPARRQQFVDEHLAQSAGMGGSPLFAAGLLAAENRSAELLPLLLRQQWHWQSAIPELLALAAQTHPHECLDAVMERTEALLQDSIAGRGRDVYQRLISWLTALHAFPELRPPVALFATHLYAEYSRLSALREELRTAQLVRVVKTGNQYHLALPTPEDDELRELLRARQPAKPQKK